ncbi:hypothetical protein [Pendulispora albinea]|uniref:Uncharacterized protein n=1 Tax=Pendulispora albinea TaxID=2741071 RepID=A0ABZ2LSC7_9BACT
MNVISYLSFVSFVAGVGAMAERVRPRAVGAISNAFGAIATIVQENAIRRKVDASLSGGRWDKRDKR